MGFRALLVAYVVGGLTFIPLLIAAILIPAWYLLPRAELKQSSVTEQDVDSQEKKKQAEKLASVRKLSGDAAASGTYAVLRRYDFQAALAALNGRPNSSAGAGGNNIGGDGLAAADPAGSAASESVYQSMYRSVFVGNKNNGSTTSLLQDPDGDASVARRKLAPANLLYIVLRHGHLMLYDSPAQVEVKHVLSLAHHKVSLQAGTHDEGQCEEVNIPEADLFTKRTAIVLTPMELPNGTMQASAPNLVKPFYLFTATNIDKEDFYHALLSSRAQPPTPRILDSDALIKLQSSLHSSSLTAESRAIDALIGRLFLALHRSESLSGFVRAKLEKKLNRIQKPTFIPSLLVQSIDLGDAGPVFSNFRLRDLNIDGEMTLAADMKYNGGLSVTLLAIAKLDLGTRFKVRTVDLALKTVMQRISGTMLLRIKPPPSNRIWFCFENIPELDVRVEPVVSERKITYGFVLRAIEEKVRVGFREGLVKPNWDDIPMPFSDTVGTHARGGLWDDQGEPDFQVHASQNTLAERIAKSTSMPSLVPDIFGSASTGVDVGSTTNTPNIRHAVTMPPDSTSDRSPRPPRPLRTPSISSSPSTAVDGQNVEPVRGDDASLRAPPSRKLWRPRGSTDSPTQKDALAELRELQSKAEQLMASNSVDVDGQASTRSSLDETIKDSVTRGTDRESLRSQRSLDSTSTIEAATRTPSTRSSASVPSTAGSSVDSAVQSQGRKSNLLAATVNATTAAKNWSWNAIQRNRGGIARPEKHSDVTAQQPIGRGMPLPPPGQPLPGPQKGLFGGVGSLRRRPVPSSNLAKPARQLASTTQGGQADIQHISPYSGEEVLPDTEEEFQPWQENSGHSLPETGEPFSRDTAHYQRSTDRTATELQALHNVDDAQPSKVPPPLPARRNQKPHSHVTDTEHGRVSLPSASTPTEDEITNAPALRVPDSEVSAIAEEISTSQHGRPSSPRLPTTDSNQLTAEQTRPDPKTEKNAHLAAEGFQTEDFAEVDVGHEKGSAKPEATVDVESGTIHGPEAVATSPDIENVTHCTPTNQDLSPEAVSALGPPSENGRHDDNDGIGDDEVLSRVRARIKERTPAVERMESGETSHKTSPSVGFSDGWPSH